MSRYSRSEAELARSLTLFPGGVNSPVRALGSVGGVPFFATHGDGPLIFDVDGNRYLDYVLGYGPLILGHGHPGVRDAIRGALDRALCFGAPTQGESQLAERVRALVPSMERMRFVSSGTEATMSALRLARGVTGREKFVKFDGCYHGHADALLVKAGSGALTFGNPSSAGVTRGAAQDTLVADFNDLEAVEALFAANPDQIAAVIVEPVPGNMGLIPPLPGFLEGLRRLTTAHGALLIFDEVMSGFRVALGGAQALYGVTPDLTCLGKVIGGGLPIGAYGGRSELLTRVAPEGPVYQAGTNSGNPLSVAAGLATLEALAVPGALDGAIARTRRLARGLEAAGFEAGVPVVTPVVGTMFTPFLHTAVPTRLADVQRGDLPRFKRWFHALRDRGISIPPSQYEAWFTSLAHDDATIDATLEAAGDALRAIA